jgi:hypothetical protein
MTTNLDPTPYRCDRHGGRWGDDETCYTCVDERGVTRPLHDGSLCVYDPRPEFDVADNPILEAVSDFEFPADELASLDLDRGGDDRWFWLSQGATPEEIDHARTVLERIVEASA